MIRARVEYDAGHRTLPVGVLTDRTSRTRLLALSIVAWSAATFCSGAALSYPWLLISRTLLGAVAATSGPTVASLTGDYFPAAARARVYGLILGGDLVGTGAGSSSPATSPAR